MIAPIPEILPETEKELKEILDRLSKILNEAVAFGTHILKWDVVKKRPGKDNNIPSIFLRNIIELADSISILISNSSIDPAKIIFRSLVESCYSLMYMLKEDEKQRAYCFMVSKAISKIKNCNKWISNENAHKEFLKSMDSDNLDADLKVFFDHPEFTKVKKQKEKLLGKSEFNLIYEEYLRTKRELSNNPNWYSLFNGPRNFRELTVYLDKALRYEFYYKTFSDNVHGTSIEKGFTNAGDGRAQVIQIRDFENVQEVFSNSVAILIETYFVFVRKRVPEKESDLKDWFVEFKDPYFDITKETLFNYQK